MENRTILGSPPLVRERRSHLRGCFPHLGITPARAGKTSLIAGNTDKQGDHPRSCGKDAVKAL